VVVLNHNGHDLLRDCLESLESQSLTDFETIVVDNGSTDGSCEMVKEKFPLVRVLPLGENFGFSIANNAAIRNALERRSKYVLLLNNDTTVASDFIAEMVRAIDSDERIGAVCPKIFFADPSDLLWYAGGDFSMWTANPRHRGWKQRDTGQFDEQCDVTLATGCALLVRSSALRDVGLLDEQFWAYLEDVEWSVRFLKKNYRLVFAPKARVWHRDGATWVRSIGAGSAVKRQFLSSRNMLFLAWKHARPLQLPFYLAGFLFHHVLFYSALRIIRKDYRAFWAVYRGIAAGVGGTSRDKNWIS